ncbi:MAG TPA: alkaline phosphatase family protein [Gemmatimonadales bacterium]|nr:alkaline phosphatase family protein [Gemmatimonadales bacterium]
MTTRAPAVLLGLDAADLGLIQRLGASGSLPNLYQLLARGRTGLIRGEAERFAGAVWPTFYTGQPVACHGVYHNKLWRQEHMRCEIAAPDWCPEPPFWERLRGSGRRIAVVDVPMTIARPAPLEGISLAGWGTHDVIARGSWPASLWREIEASLGPPGMPPERFGSQTPHTLARLAHELRVATSQAAEIGARLYRRESWDLFLLVFGAAHRGGHYLWDLSQVETQSISAGRRRALGEALASVYRALDAGVGRILELVPSGARVVAFALHGMGPNTTWADRCADILARIMSGRAANPASRRGLMYAVKQAIPWRLARAVTTRIPPEVQARLVPIWSARMFDWRTTRAFPLPMDHAGYVRINLRGREPQGIVAPEEYGALCDEIAEGFLGFRDGVTGKPIVRQVHRLDALAPAGAAARDRLPDLVIEWSGVPPAAAPVIRSDQLGELSWKSARLPSGRAGNHTPDGWFVAAGPGIEPGATAAVHPIVDLVPTVYRWLGLEPDPALAGQPIPELVG